MPLPNSIDHSARDDILLRDELVLDMTITVIAKTQFMTSLAPTEVMPSFDI